MDLRSGATRHVFILGKLAIKIPRVTHWRCFLHGLLANMQERTFWKGLPNDRNKLCPVWFSIPGGFLVVMPRVTVMTEAMYCELDYDEFTHNNDWIIPVENKPSSFGYYEGRIVAIDYGS